MWERGEKISERHDFQKSVGCLKQTTGFDKIATLGNESFFLSGLSVKKQQHTKHTDV